MLYLRCYGLHLLIIHFDFLRLLLLSIQCGLLLLGILISHLLLIVLDLLLGKLRLLVELNDTDKADEANDSNDSSDTSRARGFCKLCRIACLNVVALTDEKVPNPPNIWQH